MLLRTVLLCDAIVAMGYLSRERMDAVLAEFRSSDGIASLPHFIAGQGHLSRAKLTAAMMALPELRFVCPACAWAGGIRDLPQGEELRCRSCATPVERHVPDAGDGSSTDLKLAVAATAARSVSSESGRSTPAKSASSPSVSSTSGLRTAVRTSDKGTDRDPFGSTIVGAESDSLSEPPPELRLGDNATVGAGDEASLASAAHPADDVRHSAPVIDAFETASRAWTPMPVAAPYDPAAPGPRDEGGERAADDATDAQTIIDPIGLDALSGGVDVAGGADAEDDGTDAQTIIDPMGLAAMAPDVTASRGAQADAAEDGTDAQTIIDPIGLDAMTGEIAADRGSEQARSNAARDEGTDAQTIIDPIGLDAMTGEIAADRGSEQARSNAARDEGTDAQTIIDPIGLEAMTAEVPARVVADDSKQTMIDPDGLRALVEADQANAQPPPFADPHAPTIATPRSPAPQQPTPMFHERPTRPPTGRSTRVVRPTTSRFSRALSHVSFEDGSEVELSPEVFREGLPAGVVMGGCRIEAMLGRGGMGAVYRAQHIGLDRPVAVKVLPAELLQREDLFTRFQAEARAVARLEHPNIIQVHHFGVQYGHPFLVMQLLDGETLGAKLKREKKLPSGEAIDIGMQAARGLAVAHKAGIVHRDIKPDNMFITSTGVVKLLDFGLAKEVEADVQISMTGAFLGTPAYAAPEQAKHDKDISAKTDLYSLGITLFHALTGEVPFTGPLYTMLNAHAVKPLPSLQRKEKSVPDELDELIHELAEKKPEDRPDNADEVADRFEWMKLTIGASSTQRKSLARANERLDALQSAVKRASTRRRYRVRRELRRRLFRYAGVFALVLATVAGIIGIFVAFAGTGAGGGRTSEELQASYEALVRRAKANPDADEARVIIIDMDAFLTQAPEFDDELEPVRADLQGVIEGARPLYDQQCDALLQRADEVRTNEHFDLAADVLADIGAFLGRAPEYRERFAEARPALEEMAATAQRERNQRREYESLLRRAQEAGDPVKAQIVLADVDAFLARAPDYTERLAETHAILDAMVTKAAAAAEVEREASELMYRAGQTIDPGLSRMVLKDIAAFLKVHPDFEPRFEVVRDNLKGFVAREAEQAARQRQAGDLYRRAQNAGTAAEAIPLLAELDAFLKTAVEFTAQLQGPRRRLLNVIAQADAERVLDEEAQSLIDQANQALISGSASAAGLALNAIDEFLTRAPEYAARFQDVRARLEQMVALQARNAALDREATGLERQARLVRDVADARAVLQALEAFVGRAPNFDERIKPTREWLAALIAAETTRPDELSVPADVAGLPWQTRRFQLAGPFTLQDVLGDFAMHHREAVTCVAISADGQWILSGSRDFTARIFEVRTGREARVFDGHTGTLTGVAFLPGGREIVTGSEDGTSRIWDTASGAELHVNRYAGLKVTSVAAPEEGDSYAIGLADGSIRIHALEDHRAHAVRRHVGAVTALAFNPRGDRLISGGADHLAVVWDVRSEQPVASYSGHAGPLTSIALASTGTAISAASDLSLRVWNAETGGEKATLTGHALPVLSVAVSRDGQYALTGSADLTARLWRVADGTELRSFEDHAHYVSAVAFAPDGRSVVTGSWDATLRLYEVPGGEPIMLGREGHVAPVTAVASMNQGDPAERRLISGDLAGRVMAWPAQGGYGRTVAELGRAVMYLRALPAGGVLALTADDGAVVVDLASGEVTRSIPMPDGVKAIVAADGLVAGAIHAVDERGTVVAIVVNDGEPSASIVARLGTISHPIAGTGAVALAIDPADGNRVAIAFSGGVVVWNLQSEQAISIVAAPPDLAVTAVGWDATGRYLAVGAGSARVGTALVYEFVAGEPKVAAQFSEPHSAVRAVSFWTPEIDDVPQPLLLSAADDGRLRVHAITSGETLHQLDLRESGARPVQCRVGPQSAVVATDRGVILRFALDTLGLAR